MSVKESIEELVENPSTAAVVSAIMASPGIIQMIDFFWECLGRFGTVIGIILTVVLIVAHITRIRKMQYELKIMKEQESKRKEEGEEKPPKIIC